MSHTAKRQRLSDEWVTFFSRSKKQELRLLSNFGDLPVEWGGLTFSTGEHRFHHAKFTLIAAVYSPDSFRAKELRGYALRFTSGAPDGFGDDGLSAKRAGGKGKRGLLLTKQELLCYNGRELQEKMVSVQREIVRHKARNKRVRDVLSGLGEHERLLHFERGSSERKPSFWGGSVSRETGIMHGHNMLGRLWDEQRDSL